MDISKKEKVTVFPTISESEKLSEQQGKANKYFYAGLQEIKGIIKDSTFGDCPNCKFSADHLIIGDKDYEICKYPNE